LVNKLLELHFPKEKISKFLEETLSELSIEEAIVEV